MLKIKSDKIILQDDKQNANRHRKNRRYDFLGFFHLYPYFIYGGEARLREYNAYCIYIPRGRKDIFLPCRTFRRIRSCRIYPHLPKCCRTILLRQILSVCF